MRIALSAVWLGLAVAFVVTGWRLQEQADEPIPALEASNPRVQISSEGFHLEIDVAGTPLEGPFVEFEREVNEYVEELGASLQQTRERTAIACYLASALSLVGLALTWRTPVDRAA